MAFGKTPVDQRERLSREHIPSDLRCTLCDEPRTYANVAGYQGHMAGTHNVFFEKVARDADNERLQKLSENRSTPEEPQELPVWAKVAIVKHELFGETYAAVSEQMGKSAATLSAYAKTPAGQKVIAEISEISDVKNLTKLMLDSATMHMYADWLMALEWAKGARDYKMLHTMMKDIGLQPILADAKQASSAPTTLVLNLGTGDLKTIEAKSTVVIDGEFSIDEH